MANPNSPDQMSDEAKAAAAEAAEAAKAAEAERKTHVKMTKSGEKALHVHPSTVEAHKAAGWTVA